MPRIAPLRIRPTLLQLSVRRRPGDEPYLRAYPLLLAALRDRVVTPTVFVEAAHIAYGWMPTALSLSPRDAAEPFLAEAALVERVRGGGALLTADELGYLASSMTDKDGSVIGLSKVLHFICPERYAIWDTRIYASLYPGEAGPMKKPNYVSVNRAGRYMTYHDELASLIALPDFQPFHDRVNRDLGYAVTAMRAAEVVMFSNAPAFIAKAR